MAYQQAGAMGGGPSGANEHHGPQGTEYTLQGVMRFLQIEWHNHERARNAWDIERAEMKAKIAKQEGVCRHSKRINEQLQRQITMLERALRTERAKNQGKEVKEEQAPVSSSPKDNKGKKEKKETRPDQFASNIPHNSFLDTSEPPAQTLEEKEKYSDKSRKYLEKCMQEIQYLLTPPAHPPPPQMNMPTNPYNGLPEPPMPMEDWNMRQRQKSQAAGAQAPMQQSAMPNHQPPPVPQVQENLPQTSGPPSEAPYMTRESPFSQNMQRTPEQPSESLPQPPQSQASPFEEHVEHVTHSYDSYGRQIPPSEEQSGVVRQIVQEDHDGWNFDDQQILPEPTSEAPGTRRPDTDVFPSANAMPAKSPPRSGPGSHRRRSSGSTGMARRRSSGSHEIHDANADAIAKADPTAFRVKFALRGHLDVVRSVIFTGGGSPSEPEICTAGDDGTIKRWIIPASYNSFAHNTANDLDIPCYFTHRGHEGIVTSLAACPPTSFSTGGRSVGDGWIFSGGQDATIRVWERGRVDPKATLDGHTDAVWSVAVLPGTTGSVFGAQQSAAFGGPDRILLASGSADGTVKIWAVSAPPQLASPQQGSRRGVGGSRRHSVTSGSNHPNSPQPNTATTTPFHATLVHSISRPGDSGPAAAPTSICALSPSGENFVVAYTDACILVFDTRTGEEIIGMASNETYDGTRGTSINAVVAASQANLGVDAGQSWVEAQEQEEAAGAGPTGSAKSGGVEGVVVSGHEDRYIRFFDANSGQCTYTMLAHPSAISSLSLSKDGREAVSAGHDASIRFWSLDKRICTQDITSHRPMRGEGVCSVVWSHDGRYVVSAGGDGVVKVFAR